MSDWFPEWVQNHCTATGADAKAHAALLANREAFVDRWHATPIELGEVTVRLVERGRVPKFANEHSDAVGRELNELRVERAACAVDRPGDFAPDCPACGGSGIATVPHPLCVLRTGSADWKVRPHPEQRKVVVVGVLCDRPGCEAGRVARGKESQGGGKGGADERPRRPLLSQAERHHGCDLVALLRDHERDSARLARDGKARDVDGMPNLAASIGLRVPLPTPPGRRGAA